MADQPQQVPTPNPTPLTPDDLVCFVRVGTNIHQILINRAQREFILGALVHASKGSLILNKEPMIVFDANPEPVEPSRIVPARSLPPTT